VPGHIIGIEASVHVILTSKDPMTYTKADWRDVERALGSLKGKRIGGHEIVEVNITSMGPTAASISAHSHAKGGR
jgi:hypothetical protein